MFWRDVLLAIGCEDDVEEAGLHQLVHDLDAVPAEKQNVINHFSRGLEEVTFASSFSD